MRRLAKPANAIATAAAVTNSKVLLSKERTKPALPVFGGVITMTSITSSSSGVPSGVGVHVASGVVIVVMPVAVLKFMYVSTVLVGVGVGVFVGSGVFVGVAVDVASGVLVGHSSGVALTRLGVAAVMAPKETNSGTTSPASPIFLRSKSDSPCFNNPMGLDCMSVLISAPATATAVPARDALGRDRNRDARGQGSP
jgi:hypothetical protein